MKLIVNNDLNDIYYNYINNNFKQIIIKGDNYKYNIQLKEKNKLNYLFENNELVSKMNTYTLINLIVDDFFTKNIESCQKNFYEGKNSLLLENDKNQNVMIYSSNMIKNFPLLVDSFDKINIINDNIYNLIDNNLVDKIEIHYTKLINSIGKNIAYHEEKNLIKIIITSDLENMEEIKQLINYYKKVNGNYNAVSIIDFENIRHKQIISFDNNKEINIFGKEMIDYLERGKVYGKIIDGKISKFM